MEYGVVVFQNHSLLLRTSFGGVLGKFYRSWGGSLYILELSVAALSRESGAAQRPSAIGKAIVEKFGITGAIYCFAGTGAASRPGAGLALIWF